MGTDETAPAVSGEQPVIVEIECAELRTVAHATLNAVEMTVTDPAGNGFRTWVGADIAPSAALRFCAAVVRLISDPT